MAHGGHNIPPAVIERRYKSGIRNLLGIFIPIVDEWMIIDNSDLAQELVAEGGIAKRTTVYDKETLTKIKEYGK